MGKSILAGYFIDFLKCLYPNATIAYFFLQERGERPHKSPRHCSDHRISAMRKKQRDSLDIGWFRKNVFLDKWKLRNWR